METGFQFQRANSVKTKIKILIVEDEAAVAMMMAYLLNRVGCEVQGAWNAEKALRLAQDGNFDLITLDISMPGTNGFLICQQLKQIAHLKDTPIIFVSGNIFEEDQQRAFELGAVDYIEKPFDASDFISRILLHVNPAPVHA